ncbi:hypothetical protein, partial [Bacillus smithii]
QSFHHSSFTLNFDDLSRTNPLFFVNIGNCFVILSFKKFTGYKNKKFRQFQEGSGVVSLSTP